MGKVQNDSTLDELYKRYQNRGMNYNASPECAEQEGREILTRTVAQTRNLGQYKSGVESNRSNITDEDFVNLYRATREYAREKNTKLDTAVLLQNIDSDRYKHKPVAMENQKKDVKSKLKAEADRSNPKKLQESENDVKRIEKKPKSMTSKVKEVAKEAAKTWIPLEEKSNEKVVQGEKTQIPFGTILAIAIITISLLLIVGSTVLLSSAKSERNELLASIETLDKEIAELQEELDRKNEGADIKGFAQEQGMINQEHINAEYINNNKFDGVEIYRNEKFSLNSLINWFFGILS